ncbi:MAG: hypothetical protein ABJ239_11910 [Erythrobacter sp.]
MMHNLILHPDCKAGPITGICASIQPSEAGCRAQFFLNGDVSAIKVPVHLPSSRQDNLWKTTCFEIFWQPDGGSYYREFNLSPSSQWACYDFDDFRRNSRDALVENIAIACAHSSDALMLSADIASELPLPGQIALNAIVEDKDGNIQFWALAFQEGKPEFHSETCRSLQMGPRT